MATSLIILQKATTIHMQSIAYSIIIVVKIRTPACKIYWIQIGISSQLNNNKIRMLIFQISFYIIIHRHLTISLIKQKKYYNCTYYKGISFISQKTYFTCFLYSDVVQQLTQISYCFICERIKLQRTHHCRECKRLVK